MTTKKAPPLSAACRTVMDQRRTLPRGDRSDEKDGAFSRDVRNPGGAASTGARAHGARGQRADGARAHGAAAYVAGGVVGVSQFRGAAANEHSNVADSAAVDRGWSIPAALSDSAGSRKS